MRTLVLTALMALAAPSPRVSVKVSRNILFAGGDVAVICTVPRHPDNRRIEALLTNYTTSERQIDGEDAAITFRFPFKHIPCEVTAAVCLLTDNQGRQAFHTATIQVQGCDAP